MDALDFDDGNALLEAAERAAFEAGCAQHLREELAGLEQRCEDLMGENRDLRSKLDAAKQQRAEMLSSFQEKAARVELLMRDMVKARDEQNAENERLQVELEAAEARQSSVVHEGADGQGRTHADSPNLRSPSRGIGAEEDELLSPITLAGGNDDSGFDDPESTPPRRTPRVVGNDTFSPGAAYATSPWKQRARRFAAAGTGGASENRGSSKTAMGAPLSAAMAAAIATRSPMRQHLRFNHRGDASRSVAFSIGGWWEWASMPAATPLSSAADDILGLATALRTIAASVGTRGTSANVVAALVAGLVGSSIDGPIAVTQRYLEEEAFRSLQQQSSSQDEAARGGESAESGGPMVLVCCDRNRHPAVIAESANLNGRHAFGVVCTTADATGGDGSLDHVWLSAADALSRFHGFYRVRIPSGASAAPRLVDVRLPCGIRPDHAATVQLRFEPAPTVAESDAICAKFVLHDEAAGPGQYVHEEALMIVAAHDRGSSSFLGRSAASRSSCSYAFHCASASDCSGAVLQVGVPSSYAGSVSVMQHGADSDGRDGPQLVATRVQIGGVDYTTPTVCCDGCGSAAPGPWRGGACDRSRVATTDRAVQATGDEWRPSSGSAADRSTMADDTSVLVQELRDLDACMHVGAAAASMSSAGRILQRSGMGIGSDGYDDDDDEEPATAAGLAGVLALAVESNLNLAERHLDAVTAVSIPAMMRAAFDAGAAKALDWVGCMWTAAFVAQSRKADVMRGTITALIERNTRLAKAAESMAGNWARWAEAAVQAAHDRSSLAAEAVLEAAPALATGVSLADAAFLGEDSIAMVAADAFTIMETSVAHAHKQAAVVAQVFGDTALQFARSVTDLRQQDQRAMNALRAAATKPPSADTACQAHGDRGAALQRFVDATVAKVETAAAVPTERRMRNELECLRISHEKASLALSARMLGQAAAEDRAGALESELEAHASRLNAADRREEELIKRLDAALAGREDLQQRLHEATSAAASVRANHHGAVEKMETLVASLTVERNELERRVEELEVELVATAAAAARGASSQSVNRRASLHRSSSIVSMLAVQPPSDEEDVSATSPQQQTTAPPASPPPERLTARTTAGRPRAVSSMGGPTLLAASNSRPHTTKGGAPAARPRSASAMGQR